MISLARRKFSRNRYFALICLAFILISLNLIEQIPVDENPKSEQIENSVRTINFSWPNDCSFNLNGDFLETNEKPSKQENDQRIRPSLGRIKTLFDKLMNNEEKFGEVFDFLAVFRFNEFRSTLKPFSNDTKKFKEIVCLFERFLVDPKTKKLSVSNEFILYLEQISNYLASGFHREHSTWKQTEKRDLEKPTIVLATDQRFFDSFQASIKTVDQFFPRNVVAVYDLGLNSKSKTLVSFSFAFPHWTQIPSRSIFNKKNLQGCVSFWRKSLREAFRLSDHRVSRPFSIPTISFHWRTREIQPFRCNFSFRFKSIVVVVYWYHFHSIKLNSLHLTYDHWETLLGNRLLFKLVNKGLFFSFNVNPVCLDFHFFRTPFYDSVQSFMVTHQFAIKHQILIDYWSIIKSEDFLVVNYRAITYLVTHSLRHFPGSKNNLQASKIFTSLKLAFLPSPIIFFLAWYLKPGLHVRSIVHA